MVFLVYLGILGWLRVYVDGSLVLLWCFVLLHCVFCFTLDFALTCGFGFCCACVVLYFGTLAFPVTLPILGFLGFLIGWVWWFLVGLL